MNLDPRQRAMLEEMGIKVWWPAVAASAPEAEAEAPAVADASVAIQTSCVSDGASAGIPAELAAEVTAKPAAPQRVAPAAPARPPASASAGASVLVDAPRRLYGQGDGAGDGGATQGGWLIVADMPPDVDGRHGEPFAGDAGRLLDNMLHALQLHGGPSPVHLMRTHRGVASGREGSPQPLVDAFPAQAAALEPRVVLAMGPLAAQSLLARGEPLGKLRGQVTRTPLMDGVPVVVTYHPAYLLRTPADKARAWADLCLAAESVERGVGG